MMQSSRQSRLDEIPVYVHMSDRVHRSDHKSLPSIMRSKAKKDIHNFFLQRHTQNVTQR